MIYDFADISADKICMKINKVGVNKHNFIYYILYIILHTTYICKKINLEKYDLRELKI